jgi:hypothetical protein
MKNALAGAPLLTLAALTHWQHYPNILYIVNSTFYMVCLSH